ncbi:MAG TPA: hypothetical protein VGM80_13925 [Gaiellaceae bacterium]
MTRSSSATRTRSIGAAAVAAVLVGAVVAASGCGGSSATSDAPAGVDAGLCPFPLSVSVTPKTQPGSSVLKFELAPGTITLRNTTTGRTATLDSPATSSVDTATSTVTVSGHHVWSWASGKQVPFLSTAGKVTLKAPFFVLSETGAKPRVIDPCAIVAPAPPSTRPRATPAPWSLPVYALSQIAYAGLTPLVGDLTRHDHVHLDLIVNGNRVTVPAGIGLAEPKDSGPCPPDRPPPVGDCLTHHVFTAQVANSPIHTHSTSGLIHIEPDRAGTFTLGQFFDEWGVRLGTSCLGSYCTGGGRELRAYVDGKRVSGDPRSIVLTNRQEIAVVFGGPADFASVPGTYKGGWPGLGCGGPGEHSCFP